jgi:hypothetical protein
MSKSKKSRVSPVIVRKAHYLCPKRDRGDIELQKAFEKRLYMNAYLLGTTNKPIKRLAKEIGVTQRKLALAMSIDEKIIEMYKKGLDMMVVQVQSAAMKKAIGYEIPVVEKSLTKDNFGREIKKTVTKTIHVPGDVSAQKMILQAKDESFHPKPAPKGDIVIVIDEDDQAL